MIVSIVYFVTCCKLMQKQNYVKHEDDVHYSNNILFDLNDISFAPEVQWTNCDLYEN